MADINTKLDIRSFKIDELKPAGYNPRKKLKPGDPEFEKIKNSMTEFGYVDPIIINSDMTIIGGHQRWSVMKTLGYTEAQCVVVELDKTKEKALNIALNKITGQWDKAMLADLLKDLQAVDFDISFTGFDAAEVDDLFSSIHSKETKEDDFDVEKAYEEPAISKKGDVWLLGRHRLVCGDSTDSQVYTTLLEGKKVNLVVTDPPYKQRHPTRYKSL